MSPVRKSSLKTSTSVCVRKERGNPGIQTEHLCVYSSFVSFSFIFVIVLFIYIPSGHQYESALFVHIVAVV